MGFFAHLMLFACVAAWALFGTVALHGVVLSQPSSIAANAGKPCDINRAVIFRAGDGTDTHNSSTPAVNLKTVLSPYTYMDEVFHVPQAMQYALLDNYTSWDPMITTPPGAYGFAYGVVRPLVAWYRHATAKTTATGGDARRPLDGVNTAAWIVTLCRASNAVALGLLALVGRGIFGHDAGAFAIVTIPPLAMSGMLFYTEAVSTLACATVLYGYIRGVVRAPDPDVARQWWVLIAIAGAWAITVRQTNIVWLFYVAAHYGVVITLPSICDAVSDRGAAAAEVIERSAASPPRAARIRPSGVSNVSYVLWRCSAYLRDVSPVILVAVAFAAFVVWNDFAIVLGDKTKHVPVQHWAQIPYFFAAITVFMPLTTLCAVRHTMGSLRGAFLSVAVVVPVMALALLRDAVFHEYLVADNRHWTNVLYRHVLRDEVRRVALLTPLAVCGACAFMHQTIGASWRWNGAAANVSARLVKNRAIGGMGSELLLLACVVASCVPQGLLEPRYFIMPLVAHLCHRSRQVPTKYLAADAMAMAVFHAGATWVFVNRPFTAPDGSVGRFMW